VGRGSAETKTQFGVGSRRSLATLPWPFPVDSTDPAYTGPVWALSAGIRGSLMAQLTGGLSAALLKDFGLGTNFEPASGPVADLDGPVVGERGQSWEPCRSAHTGGPATRGNGRPRLLQTGEGALRERHVETLPTDIVDREVVLLHVSLRRANTYR
jgi:hypothetical protein